MGEPIEVPADADIDKYCEKIKNELNRLDKEAEKYI